MRIIDPPSPFAAESEWRDFLTDIHAVADRTSPVPHQVQGWLDLAAIMVDAWAKGGLEAAIAAYRHPETGAEHRPE